MKRPPTFHPSLHPWNPGSPSDMDAPGAFLWGLGAASPSLQVGCDWEAALLSTEGMRTAKTWPFNETQLAASGPQLRKRCYHFPEASKVGVPFLTPSAPQAPLLVCVPTLGISLGHPCQAPLPPPAHSV